MYLLTVGGIEIQAEAVDSRRFVPASCSQRGGYFLGGD